MNKQITQHVWRKLHRGELIVASDKDMCKTMKLEDGCIPVCDTIAAGLKVGDKGTHFGCNFYRLCPPK